MFTGIITAQAVLREKKESKRGSCLTFEWVGRRPRFKVGGSISVDGVCLTLTRFQGRNFSVDAIPETLEGTTLGRLKVGGQVNVEPPLRVGEAIGGHWVSGHVDGVGWIREIKRRGTNFSLQIEAPVDIIRPLVRKGSIAVDGISFTLQEIRTRSFKIGVIPHTYRVTTLGGKRVGDPVNLEVDLFAKLIYEFVAKRRVSFVRENNLRKQGF